VAYLLWTKQPHVHSLKKLTSLDRRVISNRTVTTHFCCCCFYQIWHSEYDASWYILI